MRNTDNGFVLVISFETKLLQCEGAHHGMYQLYNFYTNSFEELSLVYAMLFYAFYNAPLLRATNPDSKSELSLDFVDDVMFLAIGNGDPRHPEGHHGAR